ncbi:MAG: Wadjet anti-phage system protein JetA family protein, partial [Traorella sp.]
MSNDNFFEVVPENFFNIFAGSYRKSAAECLTLLYKKTSEGFSFSISKEDAIIYIEDYFQSTNQNILDEENNVLKAHEAALYLIRRFKYYGWCDEVIEENYQTYIHLQDYAVEILKTLSSLTKDTTVEYSGYISTIYDILKSFKTQKDAIRIEQVYENTELLFNKLSSLNTNIKKYIQKLLKDKNKDDLVALMNMLLDDYQSKIVDRAYYNLTTKDHPEKYRQEIIDRIIEILNDEKTMDLLTRQLMERKDIEYNDGYQTLIHQLEYVIDHFENINDILDEINQKNHKYVSSALSRITFLLDVHQNIEGKINHLIKAVDNEIIQGEELFKFYEISNAQLESLYTPRRKSENIQLSEIQESEIDETKLEEFKEKLARYQKFSKTGIQDYINHSLGNQNQIQANELSLATNADFTLSILTH